MIWLQAQGLMTQDLMSAVELVKTAMVEFYHELIGSGFVIVELPIKPLL